MSRSWGRPIARLEELSEALSAYIERAAEKLRGNGLAAGYLTVFLRTNRFRPNEPHYNPSAGHAMPVRELLNRMQEAAKLPTMPGNLLR